LQGQENVCAEYQTVVVESQNAEPQPNLIAAKPVAAQPSHLHRLLAFLDLLLRLTALVVEVDHRAVSQQRVRHNEAHPRNSSPA